MTQPRQSTTSSTDERGLPVYLQIFVVSFLALFLELSWIRYLGSEIRIFAYFQNLLLIVSFLGLGYGLATAERPLAAGRSYALSLLLVLLLVPDIQDWPVTLRKISWYLGSDPGHFTWGSGVHREGLVRIAQFAVGAFMLVGVLIALIQILAPIGRLLGRLLQRAPNALGGYSADIAGSLAGVWVFTLLSLGSTSPGAWFVIALVILAPFLPRRRWLLGSAALATGLVGVLANQVRPGELAVVWSPYQRLASWAVSMPGRAGEPVRTGANITTNHMPYMQIGNYSPEFVAAYPDFFKSPDWHPYDNYNLPYRLHPNPRSVLIVGAGAGNDVAGALRNGIQQIDAVEIDPLIVRLGAELHPEQPYSPQFRERVTVHIGDARAFFKRAERRYDLIIFATLDSHSLSSSLANVRLDNFVYTADSFREAASLLTPDGVMVCLFAVNQPFLGVRIHRTLTAALGSAPVCFRQYSKIVPWVQYFVTGGPGGRAAIAGRLRDDPKLSELYATQRSEWSGDAGVLTDDWPYLYLVRRTIPHLHLLVMAILGGVVFLMFRPLARTTPMFDASGWLFFFLGAGFMLIEVQGITRAALLFGTTWLNNAIVISGILVAVLLANFALGFFKPRSLTPWFAALAGLVVVNYGFPAAALNELDLGPRLVAAVLLICSPVAVAGVIFGSRFRHAPDRSLAFAANLVGATAGGMSESLALLFGIRSLTVVAAVFYLGAFLAYRRSRQGQGQAARLAEVVLSD